MHSKVFVCLVAVAALALPAAAAEMTVDQIIAKNIEAKGGRAKLDAVKSMRVTGKVNMGGGMEAPLTVEIKRPNKVRLEFTVQGMTGVQAFDGSTAWFVMPFMGKTEPEKMSEEQANDIEEQGDMDGVFVDYAKKGHKIELVGKEEIEGTEAYKLKVTKKNGDVDLYFLDAEYFLEIKMERKAEIQGTEVEIETNFGDYKPVGGVMMAHSIEQKPKGAAAGQMILFEKVELNVEVADDRFAMPAPVAAAEVAE